MTTLITGADGFIGTALKRRLPEAQGVWLGSMTEDLIAEHRPERIYHLAAWGVLPRDRSMQAMVKNNVLRHAQLLNAVSKYTPDCHVICAGSCFDDDVNDYGHTKRLAREMAEYYRMHHGLRISVLRFFHVYGPGEHESRLVPTVIRHCLEGRNIVIGHGKQMRSWLYVEDAVDALVGTEYALTENIGGANLSVDAMVRRIVTVLGASVTVSNDGPSPDDAGRNYTCGQSLYLHASLDDGIRAHARSLGWTGDQR